MDRKKVIIISGAFVLVIAIILFFLFSSFKSSQMGRTLSSPLVVYSDPSFQASHPNNWIVDKRVIQGGGSSFTTRVNSADTFFPRFEVQATPIGGQTKESKIQNLAVYNLPRTEITFKGKPATKLSGDLHFQFATGNPEQKPVYKVFLFVEGKNLLYTISYAYFKDADQAQNEALMQKMLDELQIN